MHMSAFASPPMFTMSRAYAMNNAQSTFEASERMYVNKFMISSDAEPAAAIRCSIWVSQCYCVGKEKAKKGREKESRDGAWNMSVQAMTRETVCYSLLVMLKIRSWGWQCTSKNYQIRIVDLPAMGKCSPKNGVCVHYVRTVPLANRVIMIGLTVEHFRCTLGTLFLSKL